MKKRIKQFPKPVLWGLLVLIMAVIVYLLYKMFGPEISDIIEILKAGDEAQLMEYLNHQGKWRGFITLYFICILQVVSVFFPGIVIQVSGALLYGWWRAFIICWLGFLSGNAMVFIAVKLFGKSVKLLSTGQTQKDSWLVQKINDGNPMFVVALAFMVPGVPNGIVPHIAAHTNLSVKQYLAAVGGSCWIQILLNCIAGHFIRNGNYAVSIGVFILQIVLICVVAKNRDKLLKK